MTNKTAKDWQNSAAIYLRRQEKTFAEEFPKWLMALDGAICDGAYSLTVFSSVLQNPTPELVAEMKKKFKENDLEGLFFKERVTIMPVCFKGMTEPNERSQFSRWPN